MGDGFPVSFRLRFMAGRPPRHEAPKFFRLSIEDAELDIGEADNPVTAFGFCDPDRLADERFADEHIVATPLDLARWTDTTHLMVGVVPGRLDTLRVGPLR